MTLRLGLVSLLALAIAAPVAATPTARPARTGTEEAAETAVALLHAAVEAPRRISFVAQVQLLSIGSHGSTASIFRVEHRAPDLTRRWYLAPQNLYGDFTISRAHTTYAIDVRSRRVVVTPHDAFGLHFGWSRNLPLLVANYRPAIGPDDEVAGRPTDVVTLVNRYTGATTMRLWVDERTDLMLRREIYSSDGSVVLQMRFDAVRFTNAIPLATFTLPAHYERTAGPNREMPSNDPLHVMAVSGLAVRAPRYLPEGFTPVAADLDNVKGVRTLHVLYSDGLRTISLFENARGAAVDMSGYHPVSTTVGALSAQYVEDGPTTLLAWSQGALHFALVGDLNRDELERIAASLAQ
ncbi:MAG TPA: sigma-E factor regulatory protein RseB domain-containing protein [Candidatus Tyrphobacter sp.]